MEQIRTKVLYISYDGMTDSLGQSQVLPYLVGLSSHYDIHLISFEKSERFNTYKEEITSICNQSSITWHPLMYTKRPPVLSTLYDIFKLFRLAKTLYKQYQFKIVHCRSYISALVGLSFKKKFQTKFIFDMRGFWADERVDGKIWNLSDPLYRKIYDFFKNKEKHYFIHSDAIISLTENGKNEILSWHLPSVDKNKIQVIPCCVNTDLFQAVTTQEDQKNEIRSALGLHSSDFVLGYIGSIGTWYMLPEMLDYFSVLKKKEKKAKFLFVTNEEPSSILNLATQKNIDTSDLIITKCLHKEVPLYASLFNQSIFFILPSYSKKASSPTKQGELMAMQIPIICNVGVGDTDLVIQKYQAGYLVNKMTEAGYQSTIDQTFSLPYQKELAREGALEFYGLENGIKTLHSIYKQLENA